MKITKSLVLYNIIVNLLVCFLLSIASSLLNGLPIDWINFFINYGISFVIAMCIGLFIPLVKIGKWFTKLFKVNNTTYTHNIKYRLLSTVAISFIYFIGLNPFLTILNTLILGNSTLQQSFMTWLVNAPIMFLIGFLASLVSDLPAYRAAKKIDKTF